jgi:hypothetical protein
MALTKEAPIWVLKVIEKIRFLPAGKNPMDVQNQKDVLAQLSLTGIINYVQAHPLIHKSRYEITTQTLGRHEICG